MQSVLGEQREQMSELPAGRPQEPPAGREPHQHPSDTQGHDLRVGQLPTAVTRPGRKQVIRQAIDADTEQVEVGAHRCLLVDVALATPTSTRSPPNLAATKTVASII